MSRRTATLTRAALHAMRLSGAGRALRPWTQGRGIIFMMHHVDPAPPQSFEPNRILKITPQFLERVVCLTLEAGYDAVSLDEAARRLEQGDDARPFACFTFDDGYRDNREHALPVLRRLGVPSAIYVASDYADGNGELWWLVLEAALRKAGTLDLSSLGGPHNCDLGTDTAKYAAFHRAYWFLRRLPEHEARARVARVARSAGYDSEGLCRNLVMGWDELRQLASDPLVTIGAHTRRHYALAKLPYAAAREEIAESVHRVEAELGRPCRHFSYPYGDRRSAGPREYQLASELGLRTAVTTEKGLVHASHRSMPTSLPRLSLNGDFQDHRLVEVLMSGLPFALLDALKRPSRFGRAA